MKMKMRVKIAIIVLCAIVAVVCLFPYFWMFTTSTREAAEVLTNPPRLWPNHLTLKNYYNVLFNTEIPRYFLNSFMVSLFSTLVCVFISALAGFALAWFPFRGKNFWGIFILCSQMVPGIAILLPLYLLADKLYLTNSRFGLAIIYQILVVPFCTWMLRGFFATIPHEIDEAAQIDGCTRFGAFLKIVLPISAPGIFVTMMFSWMVTWEEFLFAVTFTRSKYSRTIPIGIDSFMGEFYVDWGGIMASCILMSLPIVILFFFIQDKYIQGIAGGAVKG